MTTFNVHIRPMEGGDIESVHEIDQTSFSMPWPESSYRYELLKNENSLLWVAELQQEDEDPRIVGIIVVWLILEEAHIATIAVHPDFRGRGIGQEMLMHALKESVAAGMQQATLEVRDSNQIAQRLYRRFHFEVVGRRKHYYNDNNEDALIMTVHGIGPAYGQWLESRAWQTEREV